MIVFTDNDGQPLPIDPDQSPAGWLPCFLDENDPRPAAEQIDANYKHGGGWRPMKGFKFDLDGRLCYPGDPPLSPIAGATLRHEILVLYPHATLAIIDSNRHGDGAYEVARVD